MTKSIVEIVEAANGLLRHYADDKRTLHGVMGSYFRNYGTEARERLKTLYGKEPKPVG